MSNKPVIGSFLKHYVPSIRDVLWWMFITDDDLRGSGLFRRPKPSELQNAVTGHHLEWKSLPLSVTGATNRCSDSAEFPEMCGWERDDISHWRGLSKTESGSTEIFSFFSGQLYSFGNFDCKSEGKRVKNCKQPETEQPCKWDYIF